MNREIALNTAAITGRFEVAAVEPVSITAELEGRFVAYLDASPKTVSTYAKALKQFLYWLADNGISQPTRTDVMRFRDEMKARTKAATVQLYIVVVRLFFKWLADEGLYPNVADHLKGAKVDRSHKKDSFSPAQTAELWETHCGNTEAELRDNAIIRLISTCGLRTIEVVRANYEDIRYPGGTMTLYIQQKGHEEKSHRTNIPEETGKAIRAYLKKRAEREPLKPDQPLFCSVSHNSTGGRLATGSVSRICKQTMRACGFDSSRLTAHSLRHTYATTALKEGEDIRDVQKSMGHTNTATTEIYINDNDEAANTCTYTVEAAIRKAQEGRR